MTGVTFTSLFGRLLGITPGEYRELAEERCSAPPASDTSNANSTTAE